MEKKNAISESNFISCKIVCLKFVLIILFLFFAARQMTAQPVPKNSMKFALTQFAISSSQYQQNLQQKMWTIKC
jgi:hypothetical protein